MARPRARPPARIAAAFGLAAAAALSAPAAGAPGLEKAAVVAPKSGKRYAGKTGEDRRIELSIAGRAVEIVAWDFECGRKAVARTSIQGIPLRRSDEGYRFKISTSGIVSYLDGEPDENARIAVRGRFSRSAKIVKGLLRVKTRRCHDTGYVAWRATRRSR